MTLPDATVASPPAAPSAVWTCPFCPLLCDDLRPDTACDRAQQRLAALRAPADPSPRVNGRPASLDEALDAAGAWLRASRQPLVAGLGADVAAARALHPLAEAARAIVDAEGGAALAQALRAQQDRGGFTTTLAELATRADLVVFVGSWPLVRLPRLMQRVRLAREAAGGPSMPALATLGVADVPARVEGADVDALPSDGAASHLPDLLSMLAALVSQRTVPSAPPALRALAQRLREARYAVLVWEPAQLGPHAALLIERLQGVVGELNRHTRAAGLPLGGGEGAATSQQVFAWLTGLPLRSRVAPRGSQHEPYRFDTAALLADGAVDLLLWVSAWGASPPPATPIPRIVMGPPSMAAALGHESNTVFLPVAVPGVDVGGHVFRTDGVVMLPLHALQAATTPTVAALVQALHARMQPVARGVAA